MARRAIVICPAFRDAEQAAEIERVRRAFDPLAEVLAPHITLVFPFESELEADELVVHMRAGARGIRRFLVTLREVTGQEGEYLFLNVRAGKEEVVALHDRLYTGPLAELRSRSHTFVPHVTVGRLADNAAFATAVVQAREALGERTFTAEARALTLYRIEEGARAVERAAELE